MTTAFKDSWTALVKSTDQRDAVGEHLTVFCSTDEDRALLESLIERFSGVAASDEALTVTFDGTDGPVEVSLGPPLASPFAELPKSIKRLAVVHGWVSWDCPGGGSCGLWADAESMDSAGGWDGSCLADSEEDNEEFFVELEKADLEVDEVAGAFDVGQDWMVWHPTKTDETTKEPLVCFVSHEDCVVTKIAETEEVHSAAVLLRLLVQTVTGDEQIDCVDI